MMHTILIANITNSLLEDAISKTCSQKLLLIHEDNLSKKPLGLLISGLNLPANFKVSYHHVPLDDLKLAYSKVTKIVHKAFEKSDDVHFALEANLLGLQIMEAAKEFEIKNYYIVQGEKLKKIKACFIRGF
jgi:hypothetical protein